MLTPGGDTLAAFGIARLIREFSEHFGVLIPEKCHSAGTLLALGANQIVMTQAATLSPIDPSVTGPLNPVVELAPGQRQVLPVSVESVAGFKTLVKDEWDLNEEAIGNAFRILAEKVHPLLLGDVLRRRQQIGRLAEELLLSHRSDTQNIKDIIETLTTRLGSHDYTISRREARKLLGDQVAGENKELEEELWSLYKDFTSEMKLGTIYDPMSTLNAAKRSGQTQPISVVNKIVMIESGVRADIFEHETLLSETQVVMTPLGPQKAIQQELVRTGWTS